MPVKEEEETRRTQHGHRIMSTTQGHLPALVTFEGRLKTRRGVSYVSRGKRALSRGNRMYKEGKR